MTQGWPEQNSNSGWEKPSGSYAFGEATPTERDHIEFRHANPLWAPWALKVSASSYLIAAGFIGWWIYHSSLPVILAVIFTLAGCTMVALSFIMLKAQPWSRYALSVLSALGILLVVVTDFWPASLLGILAVVFLWLPINSRWFGYR